MKQRIKTPFFHGFWRAFAGYLCGWALGYTIGRILRAMLESPNGKELFRDTDSVWTLADESRPKSSRE